MKSEYVRGQSTVSQGGVRYRSVIVDEKSENSQWQSMAAFERLVYMSVMGRNNFTVCSMTLLYLVGMSSRKESEVSGGTMITTRYDVY